MERKKETKVLPATTHASRDTPKRKGSQLWRSIQGHVRTLVCTHTRTRTPLTTRFQVAQVFTMRWASSGVPVHLVPFSFQPHAPLSRLVLLSCLHSFVLRAHTYTFAFTLDFSLPSGRRVCVTLGITGILLDCCCFCFFGLQQGSAAWLWDRTQRSYHNHGIPSLINSAYLQVFNLW